MLKIVCVTGASLKSINIYLYPHYDISNYLTQEDYFVDRVGTKFDVREVECTDVLVIPYPVRTIINQVIVGVRTN